MERHLAAALVAVVARYSRLSHSDKQATRTRFQNELRDNFRSKVSKSQLWQWSRPTTGVLLLALVVSVAAWQQPSELRIEAASVEAMALPLPDKPSTVVLTPASMSHFADRTELSKVSGLYVMAHNTSFTPKGKAGKISTGDAPAVRLTATQQAAIGQNETTVPAAYEAFLRGWEHYRRTTPQDFAKAITYLEEAVRLDPNYYRAYAALAMVYVRSCMRLWTTDLGISESEALVRAKRYLREAQKQPTALARQASGYVLLYRGSYQEALAEFKEAIALDRGDSWSYAFAALALTSLGKPTEAIPYINTALRLDPRPPPLFLYYLGLTQLSLRQFENAASSLEIAARLNPDDQYPFLALGAANGHLGRMQEAVDAIARYNELEVAQGGVPATLSGCACGPGENKQLKEGLRLAGVPENLFHGPFAEKNRLKEGKIRSLIFGHRLHGRSRNTGLERSASVTKDGVAAMSGDWVTGIFSLSDGVAGFIDGDLYLEFAGQSYYGPVLRNPGGTRAMRNEYIWHFNEPFGFSVVE